MLNNLVMSMIFTCQSLSPRNGCVDSVSSPNPSRSDGGQIRGGDDVGHGHFPICSPI